MDLALNNLERLICHKTQSTNKVRPTRFDWVHYLIVEYIFNLVPENFQLSQVQSIKMLFYRPCVDYLYIMGNYIRASRHIQK